MKRYGTDAPEFYAFHYGETDKVYKIPLAASLTMNELKGMSDAEEKGKYFEWQMNFLSKYLGKDTVKNMPAGVASEIIKDWNEATKEDQGATTGE